MTLELLCDYCNTFMIANDFTLLYSGKKECWRCRYYYKDKYGHYQIKNRFAEKTLGKFMDDGTGHWVLNPQWSRKKK